MSWLESSPKLCAPINPHHKEQWFSQRKLTQKSGTQKKMISFPFNSSSCPSSFPSSMFQLFFGCGCSVFDMPHLHTMYGNTNSSSWSLGNFAMIESPSGGAFLRGSKNISSREQIHIPLKTNENHQKCRLGWEMFVVSGGYLSNFWVLAFPSEKIILH